MKSAVVLQRAERPDAEKHVCVCAHATAGDEDDCHAVVERATVCETLAVNTSARRDASGTLLLSHKTDR